MRSLFFLASVSGSGFLFLANCGGGQASAPPLEAGVDSAAPDAGPGQDAGSDSGEPPDSALDDASIYGDGGCPSGAPFVPEPYAPPAAPTSVCQPSDISAYADACLYGNDGAFGCSTWFAENVAGWAAENGLPDGGPGTACGNCVVGPSNNGAYFFDAFGTGFPNAGTCIALTDKTPAGAACGEAFNYARACEDLECPLSRPPPYVPGCVLVAGAPGFDAGPDQYQSCLSFVDTTTCASYVTSAASACANDLGDGGAIESCAGQPPYQLTDPVPYYLRTIELLCGGGAFDAGAADAN